MSLRTATTMSLPRSLIHWQGWFYKDASYGLRCLRVRRAPPTGPNRPNPSKSLKMNGAPRQSVATQRQAVSKKRQSDDAQLQADGAQRQAETTQHQSATAKLQADGAQR